VQYSVFECLLDIGRFSKMKAAIRRITRPRKDNVRYYWLCADCVKKIEAPGGEIVSEPADAVVV
jgi:CRISPR-associated protein Cas2